MKKIDHKKELKHLYGPSAKKVSVVDVPPMSFLMIDGQGDPNTSQAYQEAVSALYSVSYTLKFMIKKGEMAIDYKVMPLEGLWWTEDMSQFTMDDKGAWKWTAMIMQPDLVTAEMVEGAKDRAQKKKGLAAISLIRFEALHEGRAAQIMHVGPYAEEPPTIEKLHEFIAAQGGTPSGKHHEIYLSDPNRTAPEKLKTVIRQPFL